MAKRTFRRCCVCARCADARDMNDAMPFRNIALSMGLTLKAPNEQSMHVKCREKLKGLIAYLTAARGAEQQKQMRDDRWHAGG